MTDRTAHADSDPGPERSGVACVIGRLAVWLTRLACRLGTHYYLSTSCLHGEHDYCQSHTGLSGAKTPSVCKFCGAICICPVCRHEEETPDA
jgi:hypothetical protein